METVGQAALRLLQRLEAQKAREKERGAVTRVLRTSHHTPDAGEADTRKIAKDGRPTPRVSGEIDNLHAAGERPGVRLSSGRRPAKLVAANDDERSHYAPSPFREA